MRPGLLALLELRVLQELLGLPEPLALLVEQSEGKVVCLEAC